MLYVLVVIHNRTCSQSSACRSLKTQTDRDFRVLIFDNSDTDLGILGECGSNGWTYLGGRGNSGLPAAYNCALDHLKVENAEGHICILDDDTRLEETFISDAVAAVNGSDADILFPVMLHEEKILSPWRKKGRRFFRSFEECAAESQDNICAFNSGMIISLDIFKDYRYDENLFLDCVDYSFLDEMKRRGKKIRVVPIFCGQGFSGVEKPPYDAALKRFAIYIKDMRAYYGSSRLECEALLLKRAARLALLYRTAEPFRCLFRS